MEGVISIVGSILGSLAGKASEYTVDPIARQVSYLFKHKSKFQNLRGQLQQLKDARERVQQDVHKANRQGEEIFSYVDRWLTEVNGKICEEAAAQLEEDEEKAKQRCFVGLCPNFKSRYQLSRKAEKEANAIAQLYKEKDRFDVVSYRPAPEGKATRPDKEYEDFESRTGAFNAVMAALEDANLSIIGVYGMSGVGKTTLVKQVARQAKEDNLFDKVVMAVVTQSFDIKEIQDQIAVDLGLEFDTQIDAGRADQLRNGLKKNKKVLVILDDIWMKLDMEALGIPHGGEHQGCKILLTSRELTALSLMDSGKNIAIEILKEEEAWKLFKKMAGDISPELRSTAIEVAQKCAGLPIAIVTIAKAMKNRKNLYEWKNTLQELRNPSKRNFKSIPAEAYRAIELSYKFLEDEEHQPTFLLCSIMGHDAAIEDLLKYGMGLGLFHGVDTIEETRNRVFTLVSNLKGSSLLLDGSTFEHFDMHDVVRDVAISIASRDYHWLALGRDDVLKELSDEETMRNYNLISLQYAKVSELLDHDQLECPNLTFFSLGSEDLSLKFSNNFFKGMQKLRVLEFAKMHFPSLPLSFCFLRNVRTLRFSKCMLKDIVILGELMNLEILSLRGSKIAVIPCEIRQLTKLKLLDLGDCKGLKVIAPDVLSCLSRLEELYLYNSFDSWEVEGHEKPRASASLAELQHLSHLTTLEVHIPDEQALPKELFSEKLEKYKISIGEKWRRYEKSETSRNLKLKLNKSIHLYDFWVKTLLRKTEALYLNAVKDAMDMLYDSNIDGFSNLKHLHVSDDSGAEYVINSMKLFSCKAFPLLESLFLQNLINLEVICCGQLKAECFGQLRIIEVTQCNALKNLFSFAIARELSQLQEIELSKCKNLRELIVEKREEEFIDGDILEFSQLRSLKLQDLPSFILLFDSEKKLSSSQQGKVQSLYARSTAPSLFDQKVIFPNIKELFLSSIAIEKLWHDQLPVMSSVAQNLTSLVVRSCHNLKNLLTSSMVTSFVQLKTFIIHDCIKIEEVIVVTDGLVEDEWNKKIVFPKLDYLALNNLPNLKRFCFGNPIGFPFLRKLRIINCPVLDTFHCDSTSAGIVDGNEARKSSISMENLCTDVPKYLFNEKVALPMLEHLEITWLENLERLWSNNLAEDSFSRLILFYLENCDKLVNVFPSIMLTRLQRLNQLIIRSCDLLEEIFESQQEVGSRATQSLSPELIQVSVVQENFTFGFPQVTYLELGDLPKLKSFFPRKHTTTWPSLKEIYVYGCDKVEMFAYECMSFLEAGTKDQQEISIQQPLFWIDKLTFPNLQQLTFAWNDGMKEILHGHRLASDYFCKLKVLRLVCYPHQLAIFPSYLFQLLSLPNLERLDIEYCYFKEMIFQSEGVGGKEKPTSAWMVLSRLSELRLLNLEELMYLWKEKEGFQNLKILDVRWCPKLKGNLVPSSVCFQNLMSLVVERCDGIIKLVTHSTAKSLVQLREMRISNCGMIEEIIEGSNGDHDEVNVEISFPQLNLLELAGLSKLESFCSSRNHSFGFPFLASVVVEDCPKMKTFSQEGLNAPMLHKVRLNIRGLEEHWIWEGSLNSTIQHMFKESNPMEELQNSIKDQGSLSLSNTQST